MVEAVEERENVYLPCWQVSKLTIIRDDAEAAQRAFHGGKLNLHLPEVEVEDVEEVEEHPGPAIVPRAPENIAGVERSTIAETLDPTRYQFEP
jgi:hypothetical protein